jgi:thiamine pyrophosphokinase
MISDTVTISRKEYKEYLKLKKIQEKKQEDLELAFTLASSTSDIEDFYDAQQEIVSKNE